MDKERRLREVLVNAYNRVSFDPMQKLSSNSMAKALAFLEKIGVRKIK